VLASVGASALVGLTQGLLDADSDLAAGLARTRYLVLDEADRLLEPSFEPELRAILSVLPAARQTLLFSATMTRSLVALQSTNFADAFYFEVLLLANVLPNSQCTVVV